MQTWLRHIVMIGALALLTAFFGWGRGDLQLLHFWNRTIADAAYLLLCLTLSLGPAAKFIPALRPALSWRREMGIAFTAGALAHVLALTGAYKWDFTFFFIRGQGEGRHILTTMYAASNWVGLVALLYAFVLTLISNDWAQNKLGQGWKFLQQQSYTIFVLVLLHAALFIFAVTADGPGIFRPVFIFFTLLAIGLQAAGYGYVVLQQARRRKGRSDA